MITIFAYFIFQVWFDNTLEKITKCHQIDNNFKYLTVIFFTHSCLHSFYEYLLWVIYHKYKGNLMRNILIYTYIFQQTKLINNSPNSPVKIIDICWTLHTGIIRLNFRWKLHYQIKVLWINYQRFKSFRI